MRGLTIIVTTADPARLRNALTMALAATALGGRTQLFFDGAAVAALRQPIPDADAARWTDAGLPTLATLVDEAFANAIRITLCQTGLALTGASPADFDPRASFGGIVSILATLDDDRLVVA